MEKDPLSFHIIRDGGLYNDEREWLIENKSDGSQINGLQAFMHIMAGCHGRKLWGIRGMEFIISSGGSSGRFTVSDVSVRGSSTDFHITGDDGKVVSPGNMIRSIGCGKEMSVMDFEVLVLNDISEEEKDKDGYSVNLKTVCKRMNPSIVKSDEDIIARIDKIIASAINIKALKFLRIELSLFIIDN